MSAELAVGKVEVFPIPKSGLGPVGGIGRFWCPGCHYGITSRLIKEVLDEMDLTGKTIMLPGGGCGIIIPSVINISSLSGAHGPGIALASAIKRVHPDAFVLSTQGDGEVGAIGLGYFVAAMLRAEKISVVMVNNACYATTGGQIAATTLLGMTTTTCSTGRDALRDGFPLHAAELAATFEGVAYSARVSVHTPANRQRAKRALTAAFQKQLDKVGFGFVELLSACPPNWHLDPLESLKFVEEQMISQFPLGEFKNVDKIDYSTPEFAKKGRNSGDK